MEYIEFKEFQKQKLKEEFILLQLQSQFCQGWRGWCKNWWKRFKIDVFRSSGPGGQSVNTTDSAVRITHIPSGIVVSQQDEKSQIRNKEKGLKILRSRIYELERKKLEDARSKDRKDKIGTGDRSERIRTYNFPQGRVTDHRINLTLHKLEEFMEEVFDEIVESLSLYAQEQELRSMEKWI